jgi:hypothetical protein
MHLGENIYASQLALLQETENICKDKSGEENENNIPGFEGQLNI